MIEIAVDAATAAGHAILQVYAEGLPQTGIKADNSPITQADRSSHAIIAHHLARTGLPVISEEEQKMDFKKRRVGEYCWLVDPLDGTKEFLAGNGEFTVNIGLVRRGKPVAGVVYIPHNDVLYAGSAETGVYKRQTGQLTRIPFTRTPPGLDDLRKKSVVRVAASRSHPSRATDEFIKQFSVTTLVTAGSSLKFLLLLEKEADIYPRLGRTMEWDTAAAHAILNAAHRGIYRVDDGAELVYNKQDLANPYFIAY